jgi:hypothetical protein
VLDALITTEDGGNTWTYLPIAPEEPGEGQGFPTFSDLQVAPSDPGVIYVGTGHVQNIGNIEPDGRPARGMFKSVNGGVDWIPINTGLETGSKIINSITVHPDSAEVVYIGTFSDGIYKTTNGGLSWEAKNQGLGSSDIRCIAMDPNNPNLLYAGSGNGFGIYKSTNGGKLWTESNYGIHLICPSYLSPFGRAVEGMDLDSYDPIKKFQEYNATSWTKVLDLVIDPSDTRKLYAADLGTGIHFSEDGGASWARINTGIHLRAPTSLSISRDGTVLYAGIAGDGVLRLVLENKAPSIQISIPDSGDTVTVFRGDTAEFSVLTYDLNDDSLLYAWSLDGFEQEGFNAAVYQLESAGMDLGFYDLSLSISDGDTSTTAHWVVQVREISTDLYSDPETGRVQEEAIRIYPNPFTGFQHISYLLPFDAAMSIEVFDVTGKQVRSLRDRFESAGVHALQWDGRDQNQAVLPVGIYIIRFVYSNAEEKIIQERKVVFAY